MNKLKIFFVVLFLSLSNFNSLFANDRDTLTKKIYFNLTFFNAAIVKTYGLNFGIEKTLFQNDKYHIINGIKLNSGIKKDAYLMGGFTYSSSLRRTYKFGMFFEHSVRFGYLGSYYFNDLYFIKDEQIKNIGRKWLSSLTLGYFLGLGYDFSKKSNLDLQIFAGTNFFYRFPNLDNVFYFNNITLEAGIRFTIWKNKTF